MAIALAPLAAFLALGATHASLWLDEIVYWFYERNPELRGIEARRPGSHIAQYFFNYTYCGIQRVVHAIVRPLGLTLQRDPELFLRLLGILSFVGTVIVVYIIAFRQSRDWAASTAVAFLTGASPMLLFYAFEARVWSFATFGVAIFLALLASALTHPSPRALRIAGALLGIILGHLYVYAACLFGGLCVAAVIQFAIVWGARASRPQRSGVSPGRDEWPPSGTLDGCGRDVRAPRELATIAAFALPGIITSMAETAYIQLTYPPGPGFPLFAARPISELLPVTLSLFASSGLSNPPVFFRLLSVFVLGVMLAVTLYTLKRSPYLVMPVAALLALASTLVIGATAGYMMVPRYQVPLFGALLVSFAFAFTKPARLCVLALAAIELFAFPGALRDTFIKANGRPIAKVIATAPRDGTAVVVQHALRHGYPDPLHSFVLAFYLDERQPTLPPVPICELPSLRDVAKAEVVLPYFDGGPELRKAFAATPAAEWDRQLRAAPWQRIWLVTPVPHTDDEEKQSQAFRDALQRNGFRLARAQVMQGYPASQLGLFVRTQ
ncbi:MAG TPA: hypothetical protein VJ901_03045 [Thermoanaerobaculia bacterium]|nr:hypothetical protein [Thermoanaerobaculia bacterium]